MNRLFLALCLLVAPAAFGAATGLSSLDESKTLANRATFLLAQEKFDGGFGALQPHWPMPAAELRLLIQQTTADWPRVRQRLGNMQGLRYIGEQHLSPTLIRYSYLQRFERGSGQWQFTFQKYRDSWLVDGVAFVEGLPTPAE